MADALNARACPFLPVKRSMTPLLCIQDRPPLKRVLVFALGCLLFTGASAQTGGSLEQLFNEGATAYAKGDYAGTISRFSEIIAKAKPGPALEPVYYTIANAKLRQGDNDGAIAAFRLYLQYYPNGAQLNDARAGLTRALINARQVPEALAAIESLRGLRSLTGTQGIDNYPNLLGLTLELSDLLLAENRAVEALALLQTAPWRDQILERQRARVNELANLVRQATAISGSAGLGSATAANRDSLAARLKDATAALESIETNSSFDLPRLLRQAQCHLELDQPWEAIVVYNEILVRFPDAPDLSYALRGLIYARQAAARPADVLRLCQDFLTRFAESPFVAEVAFVGGQNALKLDDNERAEFFFGTAVEHAKDDLLAAAIIQLGITRFDAGKWPGAREMFDRYAKDFPKGEFVEAAAYRSAVSWFLDITDADRYAKAEKAIKAYVKAYPSGTYIADASYRLAVCQFAFQE